MPGADPAAATAVRVSEDYQSFLIGKRYGIKAEHAIALVRAVIEVAFGLPVAGDVNARVLDYSPSVTGDTRGLALPAELRARIRGNHQVTMSTTFGNGGVLKLDKDFAIGPQTEAARSHAWAYLPPARFRQQAAAWGQGFGMTSNDQSALLGSIPTLIMARHTLVRRSTALGPMYEAASAALPLLDAALGPRSVMIRPSVNWNANFNPPSTNPNSLVDAVPFRNDGLGGLRYTTGTAVRWRGASRYDIEVYRKDGDEFDLDRAASLPNSVANSTSYVSNCGGATTAGCLLESATSGTTVVGVRELVTRRLDLTADHQLVELKSSAGNQVLYRGVLDAGVPRFLNLTVEQVSFGHAFSYGGVLNAQVERAWRVSPNNWKQPRYDAFGLPHDWTPAPDASLHGGADGQEAYRFLLDSADDAATEATTALQTAVDTLVAETSDELALQAAEERGSTLRGLERQALCGSDKQCDPEILPIQLAVFPCTLPAGSARNRCESRRGMLQRFTGPVPISVAVLRELPSTNPTFAEYQGGELEKLFVEQWAALRGVHLAINSAISTSQAGIDATNAAQEEVVAAEAETALINAEINAAHAANAANEAELRAKVTEVNQSALARSALLEPYRQAKERYCSPEAVAAAEVASKSVSQADQGSGGTLDSVGDCPDFTDNGSFWDDPFGTTIDTLEDVGNAADLTNVGSCVTAGSSLTGNALGEEGSGASTTVNSAPVQAQIDRCKDAEEAFDAQFDAAVADHAITMANLDLIWKLLDANEAQLEPLPFRYEAAQARERAADKRVIANISLEASQFATQLLIVQEAHSRLLASSAAISAAVQRLKLSIAQKDLDERLASVDLKSRFALRRQTRSYDLWRARALSESARRLAVAARRSIESRFVVDMSELVTPEPFVEAPAVWADEAYESDLKPPAALGTTAGPMQQSGAVYINRLKDYVGNLGLFVKGYSVQRPTSVARSDVDTLQLPGPATVQTRVTASGATYSNLDPESSGWTFYCPSSNTWTAHTAASDFNLQSWDLDTLCHGQAPTRARLAFWLDPWGRMYGQYSEEPYLARHNARWQRLALNLVGTGVRDCSRARDVQACYAEPFVRYGLRHVGPAWVTNHAMQWRSLDLPVAQIEGAKALATEEWLDPVAHSFNDPTVENVARTELDSRPIGGAYELTLELTPDVRIDRIERVQVLLESNYWVRQDSEGTTERDPDAPQCGDGAIEGQELCDGNCPGFCLQDSNACTLNTLEGSPLLCDAQCVASTITQCSSDDGCCPSGCTATNDTDCVASGCGNGTVGGEEQCDPGAAMWTATCDRNCTLAICGDGMVNSVRGEFCDGNCPVACGDGNACTNDVMTGAPELCTARCTNAPIINCIHDDGCCAAGCNNATDNDCNSTCGNNVVEAGEACDGTASCATVCNDVDACTTDTTTTTTDACNPDCSYVQISACSGSTLDGCCPGQCNGVTDLDCPAFCGNDIVELPELCDGNCVFGCTETDSDVCTVNTLTGSSSTCNGQCELLATACGLPNSCGCPHGCTSANDTDCPQTCSDITDTLANHEAAGRATSVCAAPTTIWSATFESGTTPTTYFTSATGVVIGPGCGATATNCSVGGTGNNARFTGATTIPLAYRDLVTSAYKNVQLSYQRRPYALEGGASAAGEQWVAEWSVSPWTSWTALETVTPPTLQTGTTTTYTTINAGLPSNATLRVQFRFQGTDTADYMHIDSITVTGQVCDFYAVGTNHPLGNNAGALTTLRRDPPGSGTWARGGCPQVAAGGFSDTYVGHSCATNNGEVWCWGQGGDGQLGRASTASSPTPARVGTNSDWSRITAGGRYTCGIRAGGLWCWGDNGRGQVGDNSQLDRTSPVQIGTDLDWSVIDAGEEHTCGIRSGMLYCWGDNLNAEQGTTSFFFKLVPTRVGASSDWTAVSAGASHTCGIRSGMLYCFGSNGNGKLGDGTNTQRNFPVRIGTASDWTAIEAGANHSCGIRGGALYCWGANGYGQLGDGTITERRTPTRVGTATDWSAVVSGNSSTCGMRGGSPYCWGYNGNGQLGVGDNAHRYNPSRVMFLGDWGSVATGQRHSCGRRAGKQLYCWGDNASGQLGSGSNGGTQLSPLLVTPAGF